MHPSTPQESKAAIPIAVVVVTLSIASIAVLLRTYTRLILIRQFGADDAAAIVSLLLSIGCGATIATMTKYGLGQHIWDVDPLNTSRYLKAFYVSIVMYNATLMSIKFTFLLQYHRVFRVRKIHKPVLVIGVLIGCWTLSQLLTVIFSCSPIRKFWDRDMPGTCIPNLPLWYINAAGNVATDLAIFVLPLPVLKNLNLPRPQKILLMGIFSLGLFTCAISVIRLQYLHISHDATWDNVMTSCWSVTELNSGILCACLPVLRPLVSRMLPNVIPLDQKEPIPNFKDVSRRHRNARTDTYRTSNDSEIKLHESTTKTSRTSDARNTMLDIEDIASQRIDRTTHMTSRDDWGSVLHSLTPSNSHSGLEHTQDVTLMRSRAAADVLGIRPSVRTEIQAITPDPSLLPYTVPDHGIAVHVQRDVVFDKL